MTERQPPDDELVSRVLDGDATAEERARVSHDPYLQARVQEFERVRAMRADVEPVPAAAHDAAIAAALAQASPVTTDDRPTAGMLASARGRRRRHIATVVAVAAALLIGLPLLAIALTGRGTEQKSASTSGAETAANAPNETVGPFFEGAAGSADYYAGDLGALATDAQLQAAVAVALTSPSAGHQDNSATPQLAQPPSTAAAGSAARSNSSVPDPVQSCIGYLAAAEPGLGAVALTATATWQGSPALVVVYRATADTIVVVNDDCMVVARLPA